jgi:RimJ/RimL family protein N-acetyltransferase
MNLNVENKGKLIGETMSKDNKQEYEIIGKGDLVMLRTLIVTDRDHYERWQTQGEWRSLDAPWAQSVTEEKRNQDDKKKQTNTQDDPAPKKQASIQDDSVPKKRAVIATLENKPLGWVNRYVEKNSSLVWYVGIAICEDDYLNRGYGTQALKLWVNHLFANSEFHKLCLDTWSFNPRMMRVAEKIGFIPEGFQRHLQFWEGKWLDLMHYGMLREEWEKLR